MTRIAPPPTEQEQKTYRFYFLSSVWIGAIVMALSIGWWFYAQWKGNHVYQVAIVDLQADETVLAEYYFKRVDRPTIPGAIAAHDTYFLIVRDQPFKVGEKFAFEYFKIPQGAVGTGVASRRVEIKYGGNRSETYRLVSDPSGTKLVVAAKEDLKPEPVFAAGDIRAAMQRYAGADIRRATAAP